MKKYILSFPLLTAILKHIFVLVNYKPRNPLIYFTLARMLTFRKKADKKRSMYNIYKSTSPEYRFVCFAFLQNK